MLRLYLLPALITAFTTAAAAQTIVVKPNERAMMPAMADQVRIQVGVNMFVPLSDSSDQSIKAQEDARRVVYDLAEHECAVLREVLASECRLDSINVNIQRNQNFGQPQRDGLNINGNVSFRIVPK